MGKILVVDGKTGFLVPVKNGRAVAEKMIEFIEHPELIVKMGEASAEYCREKFDVEKVNAAMCEHLRIKSVEGSVENEEYAL